MAFTGTIDGSFYLSVGSDRPFVAPDYNNYLKNISSNGIATRGSALATELECTPVGATMNTSVAVGAMLIEGLLNDVSLSGVVTHDAADVTNPRIDIVVVQKNEDVGTRASDVTIVKGTPAASPVAPSLTQSVTLWQEPLCEVLIPANETDADNFTYTDRREASGIIDEAKSGVEHTITSTNGNTQSVYPTGLSYSAIDSGNTAQSGQTDNTDFPIPSGTILTTNQSIERFFQFIHAIEGEAMWQRKFSNTGGWSAWIQLADNADVAEALARLPYCKVGRSAAQSSGVYVEWDNEVEDDDGMHDLVINPDRITIQEDGDYLVSVQLNVIILTGAPSFNMLLLLVKNSGTISNGRNQFVENNGSVIRIVDVLSLVAGDYLQVEPSGLSAFKQVQNNTGAIFNYMTVKRIR
jgi:hypothetical protein